MAPKAKKAVEKSQAWIDARKRHRLSHAQVQMARELGMNPEKLGKIDNHKQERWKAPLPEFIEHLYRKRFGKDAPDSVMSVEERMRLTEEKKKARRAARVDRKLETQRANSGAANSEARDSAAAEPQGDGSGGDENLR